MEKNSLDILEIMAMIPHRYPILLVDRIVEISEDRQRCRGIKNVSANEPFFQGHYPGNPIMPGVLIIEAMAQVGAVSVMMNPALHGKTPVMGAVDNAKFRRMVRPGDQLVIDCEILWLRGLIGRCKGTVTVDGEIAASAEMTFKFLEKEL